MDKWIKNHLEQLYAEDTKYNEESATDENNVSDWFQGGEESLHY